MGVESIFCNFRELVYHRIDFFEFQITTKRLLCSTSAGQQMDIIHVELKTLKDTQKAML